MSGLVALVCCDLGAIVRGRAVPAAELEAHLEAGVGWVPANQAITPLGHVAEPNPFGSVGDLRLLPDPATRARVSGTGGSEPLDLIVCDIAGTSGEPWPACTRTLLRSALARLEREHRLAVWTAFEHEFQLDLGGPPAQAFGLDALRGSEPFPTRVMEALQDAGAEPERIFGEYAAHQFEIPVAPAAGLAGADRAVVFREVVRECARREGLRACFSPLTDPGDAGNGLHIHISLRDLEGRPVLFDPTQPGCLSATGGSFAAGVLAHARALTALTAPSPVSHARLRPHRWSAGAACLANSNREALLRMPEPVTINGRDPAVQARIEYRGADSAANPHLALAAILIAGMLGLRDALPSPPLLESDPAGLTEEEAERFGVDALPQTLAQALAELEADEPLTAEIPELLLAAHLSVKRAEISEMEDLDATGACERYAAVY